MNSCEAPAIMGWWDDSGRKPGTGQWLSIENCIHDKAKRDITSTDCPECAHQIKKEIDN